MGKTPPRTVSKDTRTNNIRILLSDKELQAAQKARGQAPMSDYIRTLILADAAAKGLTP